MLRWVVGGAVTVSGIVFASLQALYPEQLRKLISQTIGASDEVVVSWAIWAVIGLWICVGIFILLYSVMKHFGYTINTIWSKVIHRKTIPKEVGRNISFSGGRVSEPKLTADIEESLGILKSQGIPATARESCIQKLDYSITQLPTSLSDNSRKIMLRIIDFIESELQASKNPLKMKFLLWLELMYNRFDDPKISDTIKERFSATVEQYYNSAVSLSGELSSFNVYLSQLLSFLQKLKEYEESFMLNLVTNALRDWNDEQFEVALSSVRLDVLNSKNAEGYMRVRNFLVLAIKNPNAKAGARERASRWINKLGQDGL